MLSVVKFREDDLKKIETGRSISGFYVKVCIVICVNVSVLSIALFSNVRKLIMVGLS